MENWRHYAKRIDEDKNFQLVLENIENAETQKDADLVIEAWIEEQEKILNEFEMMKKGKELIDRKVNDFLIGLYFKGANLIEKIISAGLKVAAPAIKVLAFIGNKVSGIFDRFPFIGRVAKTALLALALLCATAAFSVAFAGEPDPDRVESLTKIINVCQGIMADKIGDIGNISGAQDILSSNADPELKAAYADGINLLENMVSKVESGEIKNVGDIADVKGKGGEAIKKVLKTLKGLLDNPPDGDRDAVDTAIDKWKNAGEAIEKAFYKYETTKIDYGGGNVSMSSSERYGFDGPGFKKK